MLIELDLRFRLGEGIAIEDYASGKPCDVLALVNHAYTHRLRVGDYRILMTVDTAIEISLIEEVKKCDERTY
ncbi:MAG: hypothetical protein A2286_10270 [Gammaproteobacteria bacterium RIFOXYA12_FULL_61_12]|nr:MAG: hypothetical protein A2514_08455 [Gammaproteobacteria bacterium RIFOXYD12_FULL_61_37]OGT94397.1 MAG: hypothetical protein A2286_10270 [Gammaproteobacteria bacterium RIFOXYA12_FULL_61_12]